MTDANPPAGGEKSKDAEQNKVIAAIGYLGILFLVPLLAKKDSPFAQYHAKQGLVLFALTVIVSFLGWIPWLGGILVLLGWIVTTILFVIGLINALKGQTIPLPIIGKYGENLKI